MQDEFINYEFVPGSLAVTVGDGSLNFQVKDKDGNPKRVLIHGIPYGVLKQMADEMTESATASERIAGDHGRLPAL